MTHGSLVAIGGPTASGKTDLALTLADALNGEIVNADSRQVYRGMDIGTAKPTAAQRALVPHHLLDLVPPDQPFTLGLYTRLAHTAIRDIQARGRLPILVGGTGLYLRAVTQGFAVPEVAPDPELRRRLEVEIMADGLPALVERLRALDPEGAARIDHKNPRRVIRALEVCLATGKPFSGLQTREPSYRSVVLILDAPNPLLFERADARLDAMLKAGFEAEVARLLDEGYDPNLPALSALGYRELGRAVRGENAREAAIEETRHATHAFIRRQRTWFRAEQHHTVLDLSLGDPLPDAQAVIRGALAAR
ncbi:MAG: tRNA (adenosine(37)-N6)-dimethylallyltransferase MiaA [Chloroflexota bacterium]